VQEVFGFVRRNLSGAERRKDAANEKGAWGKGRQPLSPAPALKRPEREALRLAFAKIRQHYSSISTRVDEATLGGL
jgi:hypothetical protein